MSCRRITHSLQAYLDGELPASERIAVEEHLADCQVCTAALEDLQAVDDWACNLLHEEPTDAYLDHFQGRVLDGLEEIEPRRAASSASLDAAPEARAHHRSLAWGLPAALACGLILLALALCPTTPREGDSEWFAGTKPPEPKTQSASPASTRPPRSLETPIFDPARPPSPSTTGPAARPAEEMPSGRAIVPSRLVLKRLTVELGHVEASLGKSLVQADELSRRLEGEAQEERRFLAEGGRR